MLCIGGAHGLGDFAHIGLKWINAQVRQSGTLRQMPRKVFNVEFSAVAGARHVQLGQPQQRMLAAFDR